MKVEDGAMVIDINLDDGLLDGMAAMQKFCKIAVTEPDVCKVRPTVRVVPPVDRFPPSFYLTFHYLQLPQLCGIEDRGTITSTLCVLGFF